VQALVVASGLFIGWMMIVLGVVFTALWWTALRLGRKAEAAQATR
jgi:cbb3-type cytochrome oxidase subunit 3